MYQPTGLLSKHVQAVWSASVSSQNTRSIDRWLHSDACSGIVFNLSGNIVFNETELPTGVILLPVSKQTQLITLPPGSHVVGVRFNPAISFDVFGTLYQQATVLDDEDDFSGALNSLCDQLSKGYGHYGRINTLYRWLKKLIDPSRALPCTLTKALSVLEKTTTVAALSENISLSQRQIERQFQQRMNMTPKYYQRILRVKETLNSLKNSPNTQLADLALNKGFADQAHMTREFKQIAKITPRQYSKLISSAITES